MHTHTHTHTHISCISVVKNPYLSAHQAEQSLWGGTSNTVNRAPWRAISNSFTPTVCMPFHQPLMLSSSNQCIQTLQKRVRVRVIRKCVQWPASYLTQCYSCGSCAWIDDTRLVFQPPATTLVTSNVVVK